jgi:hypothetical protein
MRSEKGFQIQSPAKQFLESSKGSDHPAGRAVPPPSCFMAEAVWSISTILGRLIGASGSFRSKDRFQSRVPFFLRQCHLSPRGGADMAFLFRGGCFADRSLTGPRSLERFDGAIQLVALSYQKGDDMVSGHQSDSRRIVDPAALIAFRGRVRGTTGLRSSDNVRPHSTFRCAPGL